MPNDTTAQVQDVPEVIPTPSESPTETKVEGTEPSQGGETPINTPVAEENIPFHKHPRWIELQREREQMRKELQDLRPLKEEFSQIKTRLPQQEQEMPDWWKEAFGTDDASKAAFKKQVEYQNKVYEDLESRVVSRIESQAQDRVRREAEEVAKWETVIDTEVNTLREKGYQFDRNELLKVVEDYSKDAQGNFTGVLFPFEKAYEILQLKKTMPTPTATARKTAAAQSVAGTKTGSPSSSIPTLTEVRNRGWSSWRTD